MKYFFDKDGSGHWYIIPADKRERWQYANSLDEDSDEAYEIFSIEFDQYRTGGGISNVEFSL